MLITKLETTLIPQNLEGQSFADEYERKLKEQKAFLCRKEDTLNIIIKSQYFFEVSEGGES